MNRIVLIGNGFDLAHGLPTSYEDFISWYWDQRVKDFSRAFGQYSEDCLCTFEIGYPNTWNDFYNQKVSPYSNPRGRDIVERIRQKQYGTQIKVSFSPFFSNIIESIETKGWVDIESEYYRLLINSTIQQTSDIGLNELNKHFAFLKELLIDYLNLLNYNKIKKIESIYNNIYCPIMRNEISIEGQHFVNEYVNDWMEKNDFDLHEKIDRFDLSATDYINEIINYKNTSNARRVLLDYPRLYMLPDYILLLNFNYTNTSHFYENMKCCMTTHIHGNLQDSSRIIFGYGDELDSMYKQLQALNDNECLRNIKSINYLESANYRSALSFMESAPFQVVIMGHSCGNSDRTLLNTLFEHKNCISIKPYYYQKNDGTDNYLDIIQNISRNFTDMKLMRDRVVNKTYCEPLPQAK